MNFYQQRHPGRPGAVNPCEYIRAVLKHTDKIVLQNNKIAPLSNSVWRDVAMELEGKVKPASIYSLTVCNRYNMMDRLLGRATSKQESDVSSVSPRCSDTEGSNTSSSSKSRSFHVTFEKKEFNELVTETSSIVKHGNKSRVRKYTILQPKKWTEVMAKKVYDETKMMHGFHFKTHYMHRNGLEGSCKGECIVYTRYTIYTYVSLKY